MSVYQRGTAINIVERFALVDPLTEEQTPTDPTAVVFTLENPDGSTDTVYTFGTDPEVTNPAVGAYVLALAPPPPGHYRYICVGTGAVEAEAVGSFDVLPDGVLVYKTPDPRLGPCSSWINGDDVAEACDTDVGSSTFLLDDAAADASLLLYELSGRLYSGVCERTVRPCRDACSCFGYPIGGSVGGDSFGLWAWAGTSWRHECGDTCGCGSLSFVTLAGGPVREIVQVKIDGATVAPTAYRLDGRRDLVRLDDPGPPVVKQTWPACQNLSLADDQPGTFAITYRHGTDPPSLGRSAAAELACELYKAKNGGKCRLPSRVSKVVRQGVTYEKIVPVAELLRKGASGLTYVDAFIAAVNPRGLTRKPAVWSPDKRPYPREVG